MWKKINSASQDIQDVMLSFETTDIVQDIAKYHNLNLEQKSQLSKEVALRLLETTKKETFSKSLEKYLGTPLYQAEKIADDVEKRIVSKIKPASNSSPETPAVPNERVSEVPANLPTQGINQKIPVFEQAAEISKEYRVPNTQNAEEIIKPQKNLNLLVNERSVQAESKPVNTFLERQTEAPRGLSQEDILQSRTNKTKQNISPTRAFASYKDEKIGGVNIEKNKEEEIEENINREDLLRDIENPVKTPSSGNTLSRDTYKGSDPYREPIE